jgi:CheY-like chemotaxis protein
MQDKILWFDDKFIFIKFHVGKLEQLGFQVKVVETFTEAEKALREEGGFQLLILDSMIPTVTEEEELRYPGTGIEGGLTFFRVMTQEQLVDPTKVLVFTVSYEHEIYEQFVKEGLPAENFLTKEQYKNPVDFSHKVKELIKTFA